MGDMDRIDDELFALDYRNERALARPRAPWRPLPEPPTIRLEPQKSDQPAASHVRPDRDESFGEVAIIIGFAILLVLVLATAGLVLWWV